MSTPLSAHSRVGSQTSRLCQRRAWVAGAVLAVLLIGAGLHVASADDNRFDIMRLVTTQWIKPFLYVVIDTSGSMHMTFDETYNNRQRWYFDSGSFTGYINLRDDWTHSYRGIGQGFWLRVGTVRVGSVNYTQWYFVSATRIAVAKNVWGSSLTVFEPSVSPSGYDNEGKAYYLFNGTGPTNGAWLEWQSSADNGYGRAWHNWSAASGGPPAGDPAYTVTQEPSSMAARFSDVAHIGLIEYSGNCPYGYFSPVVDLDPDDPTSVVPAIEARFDTYASGGIIPGGSTPTKAAIASAGHEIVQAFNNDSQSGCGRTYGVLLMTDGISNQCNPGNNEWSSCPSNYSSYPAGKSDDLWFTSVGGTDLNIRTWVLGISEEVGRCELNYTAYKGRTDASSPAEDAGFSIDDDPYLAADDTNVYDTSHGDYAFFASSVSELRQALLDIISSMGAGDYATSSPAVSSGGGTSASGMISFLGSSEYPSWQGHLRAFDLALTPTDAGYEMWDAAETLVEAGNANHGFARQIYTWDPANSNQIVAVAPGTAATLDGICGSCGITDQVVDFILGNDGNILPGNTVGSPRPDQLGALINTTPAVIGAPQRFEQNQLHEHSSFEGLYSDRHTLVWVGTSDGSVAAFDEVDGAEILRLIPPDLLANQVELYANYVASPTKNPVGQTGLPMDHIFGVANSVRFGDIWDPAEASYRTVMFIPEGPGGSGIHAVDITHPYPGRTIGSDTYPADQNYGYGEAGDPPFEVLWSLTADGAAGTTQLADLGDESWSVPAIGATGADTWAVQIGSGYRENAGNSINPSVFVLDPLTGDPYVGNLAASTVDLTNSGSHYVPNNSFADSVVWQDDSKVFKVDNVVNEGVQADLNGHLWSVTQVGNHMTASTLVTLLGGDPMYYSPAVAGFPNLPVEFSLYAFSTGSFYATNPDVSGANIGTSGHFIPKIYIAAKDLSDNSVSLQSVALTDLPDPGGAAGNTLGDRTQILAPPMIFTPSSGSAEKPFALYLVYDPDASACVGVSYIVKVSFDPEDLSSFDAVDVYEAGQGVAGGFALTGDRVIVSQSGVGEGNDAYLVWVPDLTIPVGGSADDVTYWIELQ